MRFQTATISRWLRRALVGRLRRLSLPSGLFYPVCLAFAGGVFAAVDAGSEAPGFALRSVWLYRAEVGLAFMGAIYIAGLILWLAWHGRGFFELAAFGLTIKASDAEKIETAESELTGTEEEIFRFQERAISGVDELDARLSALEERADLQWTHAPVSGSEESIDDETENRDGTPPGGDEASQQGRGRAL